MEGENTMYLYGERIELSSLEHGGSTEQKSQADVVEEILRQELTASGEFEAYYGMKCTSETLAMIDLNKPLHMRDYYITGRRFDQIEAKQKYVYAVMYAYYSEWELYGSLSKLCQS